jgi:hypothetical protein
MGAGPVPGGIATPMMAQPMMAQPMMAQPMMTGQPVAQPAASQGLASAVAPLLGRSSKDLLPIFAANPNYVTLAALSKAQEQEQIDAQVRGQQAIEDAKQMQGSVAQDVVKKVASSGVGAQDVVKKVASSGVGAQPYGFARGGIVAFDKGGATAQSQEERDRQAILSALSAAGFSAQKLAAAGFDVLSMPARALMGVYNTLARGPRAFGVNLPFIGEDSPELISSMMPATDAVRRKETERQMTPELADAMLAGSSRPPVAPSVTPPAAVPAAPVARPAGAGPVARPAGTGAGIGGAGLAGAGPVRPPAATAGAAAPDDRYGLRAASADMFKTMQGAGTVSDEEKQFRQALLEAMQAERQPPQEYKEPKGVSGRELLELAGSLNLEKGEGFGSLARGAAGILEKREAKKTEAMKANREIDAANRKLRTAVAQQQLAYASGDRQAKQAADAAVAKARYDLRVAEVKLGLESRKVGAQETAARRPVSGTSEESVELKRMQIMRQDPKYSGLAKEYEEAVKLLATAPSNLRAQQRVRNAEAALNQLAQEYGVARMSPTSGQASAAPGATLSAEDRALIERYTAPK